MQTFFHSCISLFDVNFTTITPSQDTLSKLYSFCLNIKFTKFGVSVKKQAHFRHINFHFFQPVLLLRVFSKSKTDE